MSIIIPAAPNTFDDTGRRRFTTMGHYIVRKTAYDAWRVFNVVTKEWVGNAVEDEVTAKGIARRLERGA